MRNVKYGAFVDFMPPTYDPDGLIGSHVYTRNEQRQSLETLGYEYYLMEENRYNTINDASFLEKIAARTKFIFSLNKEKVLGVRNSFSSEVNHYSDSNHQLGVKPDKNSDINYSHSEELSDLKKAKIEIEKMRIVNQETEEPFIDLETKGRSR